MQNAEECQAVKHVGQCRDQARPSSFPPTASLPTACPLAKSVLGILEASGIGPKKLEPQALEISQQTAVSVGHRTSTPPGPRSRVPATSPVGPWGALGPQLTHPLLAGLTHILQFFLLVLTVLLMHLLHPLNLQLKPLAELGAANKDGA